MRLAGKIALHVLLVFAVLLIPPLAYDQVARHVHGESPWLFVGGLTYPLYLGWWITRIRHPRIRAILLHLLGFATLLSALVLLLNQHTASLAPFLPTAAMLPCLALVLLRAAQERDDDMRTHLYGLLLLIPFALFLTALIVIGMSLTAMQGMRW
jgi:FtsH-binding integral membrane protein